MTALQEQLMPLACWHVRDILEFCNLSEIFLMTPYSLELKNHSLFISVELYIYGMDDVTGFGLC